MTPRRVVQALSLCSAVTLCSMSAAAQTVASTVHPPAGVTFKHGLGPTSNTASSVSPNVLYNGGAVLPVTTTYAIFWGNPSDFPSDAHAGLADFLAGLNGSGYLDIAQQYLFGQKAQTQFGGSVNINSPPPDPFDAQGNDIISPLVCGVLGSNGLSSGATALYIVFASNYPQIMNTLGYCAFHDYQTCPDGSNIHTIYVPNVAKVQWACGVDTDFEPIYTAPLFVPNNYSAGVRSIANSTAHEVMESITDPNLDAWLTSSGAEVGDLCNYLFETRVPLANSMWKIQDIWSNQAGGCVQGSNLKSRILGAVSVNGATSVFDIPAAGFGTFAQSVNIFGAVTGYYADTSNVWHGFVRGSLGKLTTFDGPQAGTTNPQSINAEGAVAGYYVDLNFNDHGFVRAPNGGMQTIDIPAAGNVFGAGTLVIALNDFGTTAGIYFDNNNVSHGFVRDRIGNVATFDAPWASTAPYDGTYVTALSAAGVVVGNYLDGNSISHGFVRNADGTLSRFDAPGAVNGTYALSINVHGAVAGYFSDAKFVAHGFLRDPLGNVTVFDDPNSVHGTFAFSINAVGSIAGYYSDANGFAQGFIRDRYGSFFGLQSAGGTYGTVLRSINDAGVSAGYRTKATF